MTEQQEKTWKDWLEETKTGKVFGIWSIGTKRSQLIVLAIVSLIIAVLSLYEKHFAWLLLTSFLLIVGIGFYLHSSWLWREAWRLKEKSREIDEKSREEISMAIEYLKGHGDVDKVWAWVLIIITGWMIALRSDIEAILGEVFLVAGFLIALTLLIHAFFFLEK